MSPIPWRVILTHGPTLVAAARSLLDNQSRQTQQRNQSLDARLQELEQTSVQTARLVKDMAEQLQALTLAQADLKRQLRVTLVVAVLALIVAAGALVAFVSM